MNVRRTAFAAGFAVSLAVPVSAASYLDPYTSFWALGDSLSNGVTVPVPIPDSSETIPFELRFTDDLFWSERIIQDFDPDPTTPESGDKPTGNFAVAGATAVDAGDVTLDDLTAQTDRLATLGASGFGDRPLVSVWIGGNDVGVIAQSADPTAAFNATVSAYQQSLTNLYAANVRDFLLFEVPNVGVTPRFFDTDSEGNPTDQVLALAGISAELNNLFFNQIVAALPGDVNVTIIETFDLTSTMLTNPAFFGATGTGPCVARGANPLIFDPIPGQDCAETAYFDNFHPTDIVHSFLADEVRDALTPVPLPAGGWLLLAGLGGLAALRRRAV